MSILQRLEKRLGELEWQLDHEVISLDCIVVERRSDGSCWQQSICRYLIQPGKPTETIQITGPWEPCDG
jgi:hypothetical protein